MKFISVFILFICVLAATFSKWFIITTFKINEQYIAKELCVNKSNPVMHCNGQCYLSKQLNKEEKPASPFTSNGSEKFEIQLFCQALNPEQNFLSQHIENSINQTQLFSAQQYIHINFRPPKA